MTQDEKRLYKPEEAIFHNDGREERLLEFIRSHPDYDQMHGDPKLILAAIDEYGHKCAFLMNVGSEKGKIVAEKLIPELKPDFMVELGGYLGYSTLLFGSALKTTGGRRYLSLEASPKFAAISRALVQLAGLDDIVEVRVGPCRESLRKLRQTYPTGVVDVLFIDHAKLEYVNDLKLCEELNLVGPGTTVIADNVISPGVPDYCEYVRTPTSHKIEKVQNEKLSFLNEDSRDRSFGNPYLVYETRLIDSFQPTGEKDSLEISRCDRIEEHDGTVVTD